MLCARMLLPCCHYHGIAEGKDSGHGVFSTLPLVLRSFTVFLRMCGNGVTHLQQVLILLLLCGCTYQ